MSEVPLYPLQQSGVVQVTGYGLRALEGRHQATRRERVENPWHEAGPMNHPGDTVDPDQ